MADVYDPLRSDKKYKKGMSHIEALKILEYDDRLILNGEKRFAPDIWSVFKENHLGFEKIYSSMRD